MMDYKTSLKVFYSLIYVHIHSLQFIDGQKQPARLSMINQRKPEAADSIIYTNEPSVG